MSQIHNIHPDVPTNNSDAIVLQLAHIPTMLTRQANGFGSILCFRIKKIFFKEPLVLGDAAQCYLLSDKNSSCLVKQFQPAQLRL